MEAAEVLFMDDVTYSIIMMNFEHSMNLFPKDLHHDLEKG